MGAPGTPLPWLRVRKWSGRESVIEGRNERGAICHVMGPALDADAKYAFRACNAFPELLEALEALADKQSPHPAHKAALAAIARARGEA